MSIDFSTLQGLTIPEGVVTQITDASGNVLWSAVIEYPDGAAVLKVQKKTANTYASSTTYSSESFILLDIYPKTNGTVSVTYGDLTKTITDTSGAEEPNAQRVYFGTFNGVSDEVETPNSGTLIIEGDYRGFGCASYNQSKGMTSSCSCVTAVSNFGTAEIIPDNAFYYCSSIQSIDIPSNIRSIGAYSFAALYDTSLSINISEGVQSIGSGAFLNRRIESVTIPSSVTSMTDNPWSTTCDYNNFITVASGNTAYRIDGNCLIEIATNTLICGFADAVIPSYVETINKMAFRFVAGLTSVTVPANVTSIGSLAFILSSGSRTVTMLSATPATLGGSDVFDSAGTNNIIVPAGSGATYKAAEYWSEYADYITEASA